MNRAHLARPMTGRRRVSGLLAGCATGLALATLPHSSAAQAFQGSYTIPEGAAVITTPDAVTTVIDLRTEETVINWTPTDTTGLGSIDFLPAGSTASFTAFGSIADYTVLNRILPVDGVGTPVARIVELNGTVNSLLNGKPGGNIWFYTPTGLIVGSGAVFNVGSLILTTNDIVYGAGSTGGTALYGSGGEVMFRGPAGSGATVDIRSGAQIAASGVSAYVAVVAPRIQQGGTVTSDRSIAYVAAEQADLIISAGLFDISILVGTTDPNGIVHTGTSTGSASIDFTDLKRISFVALPKAAALTMLLSGAIGYTPAVDATNDGSSTILSAGLSSDTPSAPLVAPLGSISIGVTDFSNAVTAYATDAISITPVAGATVFENYANLSALNSINISAGTSAQVNANFGLTLSAGNSGQGGDISLVTSGTGIIDIANYISADASSYASFLPVSALDGTGGSILVEANGGTISIGDAFLNATGSGMYDPVSGGDGQGGTIDIIAGPGGTISAGYLSSDVSGYGGSSDDTAGDGYGGIASFLGQGGVFDFANVYSSADGNGGSSDVRAGDGFGGHVIVDLASQTHTWDSGYFSADARGGVAYSGSDASGSATGQGDGVSVSISGTGELIVNGELQLSADAHMGNYAQPGKAGQAGGVDLSVSNGGSLSVAGLFLAHANAFIDGDAPEPNPASSPDLFGGITSVTIDNGSFNAGTFDIHANAYGNAASARAGSATGGTATASVLNGGSILVDDAGLGTTMTVSADAFGAPGTFASNAFAGTASVTAAGGTIDGVGDLNVSASAFFNTDFDGSNPGVGFNAYGGDASIKLISGSSGTSGLFADNINVQAHGDARIRDDVGTIYEYGGDGGNGYGGTASFSVQSGTLATGLAYVQSIGVGSISSAATSATPFQSGDGIGGSATFTSSGGGGSSTITQLYIATGGIGGGGGNSAGPSELAALAGGGTGGNSELAIGGGSLRVDTVTVNAGGTGGDGMSFAGSGVATGGGIGTGGTALLTSPAGSTGSFTSTSIDLVAEGNGGTGGSSDGGADGDGGDGFGGIAQTFLADGSLTIGPFRAIADGNGGDATGGLAGEGHGGTAGFTLIDSTGPSGSRTIGSVDLYGSGTGGTDGLGTIAESDAGSTILDVETSGAGAGITIGGDFLALARGTRSAAGDGFTATISGAPLTVNGNAGIDTPRDASIAANAPLNVNGNFLLSARSLTQTGQIAATGYVGISSPQFITAERISSGGITLLLAVNGPLTVSTDLSSVGGVTVQAESIDIHSLGSLTFDLAQATAGDLSIITTGGLLLPGASATGAMTLGSTGGAIVSTGGLLAGDNFTANGSTGISLDSVSSGGTTLLASSGGPVLVSSLTSPGLVTASGASIDISSPGALAFGMVTSPGAVSLRTALDLSLASVSAGGDLLLDSTSGGLAVSGDLAGGTVTLGAPGAISIGGSYTAIGALTVTTPATFTASGSGLAGSTAITADSGISLGSLGSGGMTSLTAAFGALLVSNSLTSTGDVTALARSIDITSLGGLSFAALQATAGNLAVATQDNLALTGASSSGTLDLSSMSGAVTATGTVMSSGDLTASGAAGLGFGSLISGGTTGLTSAGPVAVTSLTSSGLVSAIGGSIDITSTGGLSFAALQATAGNLAVSTVGNLVLSGGSATGRMTLDSSAGSVTDSASLTSGGNFAASGTTGVSLGSVSSGGTTSLTAAGGALLVSNSLTSTGAVSALARSIDITSLGGLSFASLQATAGNLAVATQDDLSLTGASSSGTLDLSSMSGAITATGTAMSGGDLTISGDGGLGFAALVSGGTTGLTSSAGPITVTSLTSPGLVTATGGSIDIASPGGLSFAALQATAGNLAVNTAGNLTLSGATATGNLALDSSAGSVTDSTGLTSGGTFDANGATGVSLGSVSSGGTAGLSSTGGAILVTRLTSAGLVSANGTTIDISSPGALAFGTVTSPGAVSLRTAANMSLASIDAGGDLLQRSTTGGIAVAGNLQGSQVSLQADKDISVGGALTANNALTVDTIGAFSIGGDGAAGSTDILADGGITLTTFNSFGATSLKAAFGAINVSNLQSVGAITAVGRSVTISSSRSLLFNFATATGGALQLTAAREIRASGNLIASGALSIAAGGAFGLNGIGVGSTIDIVSSDIQLGNTASLGRRGTTRSISLSSNDDGATAYFGGVNKSGVYSLDNGEASRLFADESITFANPDGNIDVGALQMSFGSAGTGSSTNIGTGGLLKVETPNTVTVNGAVTLTTSSDADTFSIDPDRIDVIADSGSIVMLSDSSVTQGRLELQANTVTVASQATIDALSSMSDIGEISSRLGAPADTPNDGGYLQVGSIVIDVRDGLFVQNSGTSGEYADRRGFTANSLEINTGSSDTRIVINGAIIGDMDRVTGLDVTPLVTIGGVQATTGGQFDALSTINGCIIGADCREPEIHVGLTGPTSEELNSPVSPDYFGEGTQSGMLVELRDNEPIITPPEVDEPITGVGNDDLWFSDCDPEQEDCEQRGGEQ